MALHSQPNSYCLLLGSGAAKESGMPTGWDVINLLIEELIFMEHVETDEPVTWFEQRYHMDASYDGILKQLGPTASARQQLLKKYFENSPPDSAQDQPEENLETYRNIAKLVKSQYLKVILTTNFDHSLEKVLREEGVEPVVISTESDIVSINPVHTHQCLIVHVNGDYLYPESMRNTRDELSNYSDNMDALLEEILRNYGLIIIGWSADWDIALSQKVSLNRSSKYYRTYWNDISDLQREAKRISTNMSAGVIVTPASNFVSELTSNVLGLQDLTRKHPLTVPLVISKTKRAFASSQRPIIIHDEMRRSFEVLRSCKAMNPDSYQVSEEDFKHRKSQLWADMEIPTAYVISAAYWGTSETDNWWIPDISRFATHPHAGGGTLQLNLQQLSGVALFYAAGVAAVASARTETLKRLLNEPKWKDNFGFLVSVADTLNPSRITETQTASFELFKWMEPFAAEYLGMGYARFLESWQRFEYLCSLNGTIRKLRQENQLSDLIQLRLNYQSGRIHNPPLAETDPSIADYINTVTNLSRYSQWNFPHIFLDGGRPRFRAEVAQSIRNEIQAQEFSHPYFESGIFKLSLEEVLSAMDILDVTINESGMRFSNQYMQSRAQNHPGIPSEYWADGSGSARP